MAPTASMSIRIRQTQAYSEGDVMREVDGLALTGDWLLVRAGYMGNLDLQSAVEGFTARRKKEQGLLMECLVSQRKTKSCGTSCLVARCQRASGLADPVSSS